MKKVYLTFCIIAASLALNACHHASPHPKQPALEVIPVKVIALEKQLAQQEIHASGQFTTEDETFLSFKTGGIINQILVNEGDVVHKGQLVATLHLNEINAQVLQAQINYDKALRDYSRYSNLYKDSVTTLEQFQNTKTALDISRQQLNTIQFNRTYSEIRATANGYVLKKLVNPGQMVTSGDPVVQINGAHQKAWILKVAVNDKDWGAIETGNTATVQTDASPGNLMQAVVTRKSEGIDPATGTFTIHLQLKKSASSPIASGLFGKAVIYPSTQIYAWSVPYEALIDGDAGEAYAFITHDFKTAVKAKVKVTGIDKGHAAIVSGLETARALIVSGSAYLSDGTSIKIVQ